jgi:hypothetical protein
MFSDSADTIINVRDYFNIFKEKEWFNRPTVKRIIKNIDKSDAIQDEYIQSPVLGAIPPQSLSDGCKAVILMEVLEGANIYGTRCGDNCVPDILEIASRKDITITLYHAMKFPDKFDAYLVDLDKYIHSREEFIDEYYKFIRKVQ